MTKPAFVASEIRSTEIAFGDFTNITQFVIQWVWEVSEETLDALASCLFIFFDSAFCAV